MRSVLERKARAAYPPMYTQTPEQAKAAYEAGARVLEVPKAELARVEDFSIPSSDGALLPARLYASEHRFPTAVDDAWDALQWLATHARELGCDRRRLAVGGDSSGATLAAVCAILARDRGLALALQLLFYPGCAAADEAPSHRRYGSCLVLEQAHIDWFFDQYIDRGLRGDWRFAPLNAPDVEGVAATWFGLAECDPLVDDGLAYADKLRAAGVAVDLEIYRGVTHEFIKMGRVLPQARQAHRDAAHALIQAFEHRVPAP